MKLPLLGLGTYKITSFGEMERALLAAHKQGYQIIDTADYYENEEIIGEIMQTYNFRDHFKIQTKAWPKDFNPDQLKRKIEEQLEKLCTDKIDMYCLHWPGKYMKEAWKVLEDYKEQGIFSEIAVCNFHKSHLEELFLHCNIKPYFDQLETHLFLQQHEMHAFLNKHEIYHQAWSPLLKGDHMLDENNLVQQLATLYKKTDAQIALRFLMDQGISVIPKSTDAKHIRDNYKALNFSLSAVEHDQLRSLDANYRTSKNPDDTKWIEEISAQ